MFTIFEIINQISIKIDFWSPFGNGLCVVYHFAHNIDDHEKVAHMNGHGAGLKRVQPNPKTDSLIFKGFRPRSGS